MKLLIIDDEPAIAQMLGELLVLKDRKAGIGPPASWRRGLGLGIEAVYLALNLDQALEQLERLEPGDAVISDGHFPTGQHSARHAGWAGDQQSAFELPRCNWPHIAGVAQKAGVIFILYSGDPEAVDRARSSGLTAFVKPAPAEALYAAIMEARPPRRAA